MPQCMILDDDEMCVPFAKSPIDAYRGTGVKYIQSNKCKYLCMGHHMTASCCCDDRLIKNCLRLDELREMMKEYDDKTIVGFGKYKTC